MIGPSPDPAWQPRRLLAGAVRAAQYGLPLLAGSAAARWVAQLLPVHGGGGTGTAGLVGVLAAAVAVSLLISRVTMRLAPLAVLLQMTMIFPDHAPSRLKVARRSTSMTEIRHRLASGHDDEQDAAVTMLALVTALGNHDRRTRGHSERVRLFGDLLARELGLSAADAGRLRWAALVHDVGKLEVAASVLNQTSPLSREDWVLVRRHPEAGARLAAPLRAWLGPWFAGIAEHHERFDGGGYPQGLAGEQISLAGRAVAVVDAFETMTSARSYKAATTAVAARAELTRCAGAHFDPAMVRAFLAIALPRLLWSVGPLSLIVNLPYLRFIGDGGLRVVQAASGAAVNAAGVTAVVVAGSAGPAVHPAVHSGSAGPLRRPVVASSQAPRGAAPRPVRTSAGPSGQRTGALHREEAVTPAPTTAAAVPAAPVVSSPSLQPSPERVVVAGPTPTAQPGPTAKGKAKKPAKPVKPRPTPKPKPVVKPTAKPTAKQVKPKAAPTTKPTPKPQAKAKP